MHINGRRKETGVCVAELCLHEHGVEFEGLVVLFLSQPPSIRAGAFVGVLGVHVAGDLLVKPRPLSVQLFTAFAAVMTHLPLRNTRTTSLLSGSRSTSPGNLRFSQLQLSVSLIISCSISGRPKSTLDTMF